MDNNITSSDVGALINFLKKNKKKIFTQSKMVKDFESIGYTTTYKVMSGVNYGVPQKRERVFIRDIKRKWHIDN